MLMQMQQKAHLQKPLQGGSVDLQEGSRKGYESLQGEVLLTTTTP